MKYRIMEVPAAVTVPERKKHGQNAPKETYDFEIPDDCELESVFAWRTALMQSGSNPVSREGFVMVVRVRDDSLVPAAGPGFEPL